MPTESQKKILKINDAYMKKSRDILKQMVNKDLDKDQLSARKRIILKTNKDYLKKVNKVIEDAMRGGGKKRKRVKRKNTKAIKKKSMKRSKKKKCIWSNSWKSTI